MSDRRPFRHLCPEADRLDAMSDDEFWEHVATNLAGPLFIESWDLVEDASVTSLDAKPCTECGEVGACAYDAEGRALIHADGDEEDR